MRKILLVLLLISFNTQAQLLKKIFKYSTAYGAYSQSNSIQADKTFYVTQSSELIETTQKNPADETKTFGFRKLAHFGYEDKERFYDGEEQNNSLNSNIGNVKGLEYLFEYQEGKQQGREFNNKQFFVRYLSKWWIAKAEANKNELVDIDYKSADLRVRIPLGKKLSLSLGGVYRTYDKAYGVNPIQKYLEENAWYTLSYEYFNHTDQVYQWESLSTGETGYDYFWYDAEGTLLSNSDLDYRNNIYGQLVNQYNAEQLALIGSFADISTVIGLDFYHYRKNFWLHAYGNILPQHTLHKGDERYSYGNFIGKDNWIDYKYGGVFGVKISKKLGLFSEITMQRYWDREIKIIKAGINFKL
jgi:hypothetical protein